MPAVIFFARLDLEQKFLFLDGHYLILNNSELQNSCSWIREFGIDLSSSQLSLLNIYLDELWEWNKKTNLTGLTSRQKIIRELLLDSMIPAAFLPDRGRLLDVGSGAGFPAIPLIICKPELMATLLEPNSKKAGFLKQVIRLTKRHQIEVIEGRIEKSADHLHPNGYHIITARALASLPQVLKWCSPYLLSGGFMVNFQGSRFADVLEKCSDIMNAHGFFLHKTIPYNLPGKGSQRVILMFKKT